MLKCKLVTQHKWPHRNWSTLITRPPVSTKFSHFTPANNKNSDCVQSFCLTLSGKEPWKQVCANETPRNRLFCPVFSLTTTSAAEQSNWTFPGECWPLKTRFFLAGLHSGMIFSAIYRAWEPRAADTTLNAAARTPNGGLRRSSNLNP